MSKSRIIITLISCFFLSSIAFGKSELYSKAFGNSEDPAVLFLHGGPGYNCASFEFSTAQKMADKGYYVIVYDRRGEGRSKDSKAKFTFKESLKDLRSLYKSYGLKEASLIGHSFGGLIATQFAKQHEKLVRSVVLVGAPIDFQESFKTIIDSCERIYAESKDQTNLKYLDMLRKMDHHSLDFAVYCFAHAMQNGFYSPSSQTEEAKKIYQSIRDNPRAKKYISAMTSPPTEGFWKNESYTSIDLSDDLRSLQERNVQVYGFYGQEDGLYSSTQIDALKKTIGENHVSYLADCSHSVFIDQQALFLDGFHKLFQAKGTP